MGIIKSLEQAADGICHALEILSYFTKRKAPGACGLVALQALSPGPIVTEEVANRYIAAKQEEDEECQVQILNALVASSDLITFSHQEVEKKGHSIGDLLRGIISWDEKKHPREARGVIVQDTRKDRRGKVVGHAYSIVNTAHLGLSPAMKREAKLAILDTGNRGNVITGQQTIFFAHDAEEALRYVNDHGLKDRPKTAALVLAPKRKEK